ncbi:hypothetical protein D3C86_1579610 [compost metagenome]
MLANSTPVPSSSRAAPSTTSTRPKPVPIIRPSNAERAMPFFAAKPSARPRITQLVVISGMKMPRIWYSS